MTDTAVRTETATALEVLSGRDVHFLGILERLTMDGEQKVRPSGTLFDLERIAHVIDSDQPEHLNSASSVRLTCDPSCGLRRIWPFGF